MHSISKIIVNSDYKYIDSDIDQILHMRLEQEQVQLISEYSAIFIIGPVAEEEGKLLVECLNDEKTSNSQYSKRTLLIPYLTGHHADGHWVGVVVKLENNNVSKVEYYNSLADRSISDKLVQNLKEVYGDVLDYEKIFQTQNDIIKQDDFASCGPCMIENLVNAVKQDNSNFLSTNEIRKHHIELMSDHHDFYERQKNNNNYVMDKTQETKNSTQDDFDSLGVSELQDDDRIKNELFFPRCEYKARFKETSAFTMSDPDYWGTYFRSTSQGGNSDRIAKRLKSDKTFTNNNINQTCNSKKETIPASKTGSMKSPWIHTMYKDIFSTKLITTKGIDKTNSTLLYDKLLQYKTGICSAVIDKFLALKIADSDKKIDVYFKNDYPCIMVQIKEFTKSLKQAEEASSLYKIVIAYFIAITNSVAFNNNIPVELVNRASFGHNIPSVAETTKSFRINIGIVPMCYADVLVESLELFNNKFLVPFLNKDPNKRTLMLGLSQEVIIDHNTKVIEYNNYKKQHIRKKPKKEVEIWNEDDSLFNVLCKVGDAGVGSKVSFQITRLNKYVDLLADYAHKHLLSSLDNDFAEPLREILTKLTYKNKVQFNYVNDYVEYDFKDIENPDIKNDQKFWEIIQCLSSVFEESISDAISSKKLKGLYSKIEKANLKFVRNSSSIPSEDGYGSESDCEVNIGDTRFYCRKITLATGMRVINLARFLSIYQAQTKEVDSKFMYYETSDVVKKLVQDINKLVKNLNLRVVPSETGVKFIDLNHCAAKGPKEQVDLQKVQDTINSDKVMVLDYTSATSENISEAIKLFIEKVPVLLLVSSGIKNEQLGADMNPYGTLRIIATDPNDLNTLYYILKANLIKYEKSPKELHNIRKKYKDAGAVVTSAAIYTKDRGYNYKPNPDNNFEYDGYVEANNLEGELNKIIDLFSSQYDDERNNLTTEHGISLNEIISWDFEKIEFLGSAELIEVIRKFDYSQQYIFDQIIKWYKGDTIELTRNVVNEIYNSEADAADINMDFNDLIREYSDRIKSGFDSDGSYENIIDSILRGNNDDFDFESYRVGFALAKWSGDIDSGISTPRSSDYGDDDRIRFDFDVSSLNDDYMSDETLDYEP